MQTNLCTGGLGKIYKNRYARDACTLNCFMFETFTLAKNRHARGVCVIDVMYIPQHKKRTSAFHKSSKVKYLDTKLACPFDSLINRQDS